MKKLYGVTTAMVTPMYENGTINLYETKNLTNFLIDRGVNCLYPLGTTGEMMKLSIGGRKKVAQTVIDTAKQRENVFIHVGAMTTEDTLELAQHAYDAGADGIGEITPTFFTADDYELEYFYSTIDNTLPNDFSIYLYSIPQLTGNELPVSVVKSLAEKHENIVGIKYSYPDFLMLKDYLTIRSHDFSVLTGADALFVPAMAMGCDGVISGVSGVYPEPFVAIAKAYEQGEIGQARKLQGQADEIIQILKAGANMSYFKQALNNRGIQAGSVKAPQQDIDDESVSALVNEVQQWTESLQIDIQNSK